MNPVDYCEHGQDCHAGLADTSASAPEASRAWLLIEHPGPWDAKPVQTAGLPPVAAEADSLGVRVQLIRRPGEMGGRVFAAWTSGPQVWSGTFSGDVAALAAGSQAAAVAPAGPLLLVCTHGRRDACCGKYGGALARALADRGYPIWETTHVGGHRFAANLVILPQGLYYGPVDVASATAAIDAYRGGRVLAARYRGRAGLSATMQAAEHEAITGAGHLDVSTLSVTC
jgi:hypothetical protein